MSPRPLLSIVMPVHNGADWLATTFDSLLGEVSELVEIIVLDSSPDLKTATLVETYANRLPITFLRRPDLQAWTAKTNLGVEIAKADYACMLHQDDLWLSGRLAIVRNWISADPEAALHLGPTAIIDRDGTRLGSWRCPLPIGRRLSEREVLESLLVQNFISVPAPVFRRAAWQQCDGMDEALWYTADWDLWLKLSGAGPVRYHEQETTAFRVHGSSLTVTGCRDLDEFEAQMQVVFERHAPRIPQPRSNVESAARASIRVNVELAAASSGSPGALARACWQILSLGPSGARRYLKDSRLLDRVLPRVRARLAGVF